ncbi:MAG: aminotransferase class III-fold pyridoxal phosphate-dependent enzyme [Candidatus Latescibacterota bacterium]|nr:MAG: aminotransferase class III-fold pyridoxal phosphate-dependent enzyme [Candidatus Latescibacterota bacterium]
MSAHAELLDVTSRRPKAPTVDVAHARKIARDVFGIEATASLLPSYIDRNFLLDVATGDRWVLKIANALESESTLDLQNRVMARLAELDVRVGPTVRPSLNGREIECVEVDGSSHFVRVVSYLDGPLLKESTKRASKTWEGLGDLLGHVDKALTGFSHPAMHRKLRWDLAHADWTMGRAFLHEKERRKLVEYFQTQFLATVMRKLPELPRGVIYNDANDANLVIREEGGAARVVSLFDFGDVVETARIFELAIACAYAILDQEDPCAVMCHLVRGYAKRVELSDVELEVLFAAVCMRLVVSVTVSALDAKLEPENEYVRASERSAWAALDDLAALDPRLVTRALKAARHEACPAAGSERAGREISGSLPRSRALALRHRHVGPSLALSYRQPLEIERGRMQYLYDKSGRAYLDCVNNVAHVGHCHPHVVEAAQRQIETLNTNTRYLHDHIALYAQRLASLFPDPLQVCYFVNSGSEANELALRLARTYTGRHDMIAIAGGYHGHTTSLVELSPYKHAGPGGAGAPEWLHVVPCPDLYRGCYRDDDADAPGKYAAHVAAAAARGRRLGREIAGFFAEPLIGCGGQVVPPHGYLRQAFEHVHEAGGVCIADEVQVGFGRVGTSMWGFEMHDVVPDIVTLGKPIGNGHPLAAVVTTAEIAAAFDNGMEFFSTFGGNPVSCAIGLAVLDVIEREGLQEHALRVGNHLLAGFQDLAQHHEEIGDVRGSGLYLGVELVQDRRTRRPDAGVLASAIESARDTGVLLSADGPDHNVLKIKPPLPFTVSDADLLLSVFDSALSEAKNEWRAGEAR